MQQGKPLKKVSGRFIKGMVHTLENELFARCQLAKEACTCCPVRCPQHICLRRKRPPDRRADDCLSSGGVPVCEVEDEDTPDCCRTYSQLLFPSAKVILAGA